MFSDQFQVKISFCKLAVLYTTGLLFQVAQIYNFKKSPFLVFISNYLSFQQKKHFRSFLFKLSGFSRKKIIHLLVCPSFLTHFFLLGDHMHQSLFFQRHRLQCRLTHAYTHTLTHSSLLKMGSELWSFKIDEVTTDQLLTGTRLN